MYFSDEIEKGFSVVLP